MPKFNDLTGMQIGEWLVISRAENDGISTRWLCKCSCGNERIVRASHLASKSSTCCGCKQPIHSHGQATKKGFSKKYKTWRQMKNRCCNPNHKNANIYNGLLCDDWQKFEYFDAYMPEPPNDEVTIDRIDNSKGYEPGNVKWATVTEQHRNQSNCRWIQFGGKNQLLTDWAKELGITSATLLQRMEKWGIEKALTTKRGVRVLRRAQQH